MSQHKPLFFIGLHNAAMASKFKRCMFSVNRLRDRKSDFIINDWIMDSGAFTEISTHGRYRSSTDEYAQQIVRWSKCGTMLAAVSQDYMCEPFILDKTGLSVADHQRLTIDRYIQIKSQVDSSYIMPVIQGYEPQEYADHVRSYGALLQLNAWVGVGSVCKRNSSPSAIAEVLGGIKNIRPDLRLHGFGIKITALRCSRVNELLYSCDSMAWSFAARCQGRNQNHIREPLRYLNKIENISVQNYLPGMW